MTLVDNVTVNRQTSPATQVVARSQ